MKSLTKIYGAHQYHSQSNYNCTIPMSNQSYFMAPKRGTRPCSLADNWTQHILRIHFSAHVTNHEIRRRSAQPPVTLTIKTRQMKLFGYIVRFDPEEDHACALNAGNDESPKDWRRPCSCRPSSTNMVTHCRARPLATKHHAVDSQALCTRPSSLATSGGDGYTLRSSSGLPHDDDDALCST